MSLRNLFLRSYIFFWSSGIMDCMLFTIENNVPLIGAASFIITDEQFQ